MSIATENIQELATKIEKTRIELIVSFSIAPKTALTAIARLLAAPGILLTKEVIAALAKETSNLELQAAKNAWLLWATEYLAGLNSVLATLQPSTVINKTP